MLRTHPLRAGTQTIAPRGKPKGIWDSDCTGPGCYGVPFYREYLTGSETAAKTPPPFIRLAGMQMCQRETMAPNHGHYFVDTSVSTTTQQNWKRVVGEPKFVNVFRANETYDFFDVFATKDTEHTQHIYVGPKLDPTAVLNSVGFIRVQIPGFPFIVNHAALAPIGNPPVLTKSYDAMTGVLTVVTNQTLLANDYATAKQKKCQPIGMCSWSSSSSTCGVSATAATLFPALTPAERSKVCSHAGEDVDCPTGGCVGILGQDARWVHGRGSSC